MSYFLCCFCWSQTAEHCCKRLSTGIATSICNTGSVATTKKAIGCHVWASSSRITRPSPRLCVKVHTSRLQRWLVVGNVWKIWPARDLNPIPPAPQADVLQLAPFW